MIPAEILATIGFFTSSITQTGTEQTQASKANNPDEINLDDEDDEDDEEEDEDNDENEDENTIKRKSILGNNLLFICIMHIIGCARIYIHYT